MWKLSVFILVIFNSTLAALLYFYDIETIEYVVWRVESIKIAFLFVGVCWQIGFLGRYFEPYVRGPRLCRLDMMHSDKLDPPKFVDIGFSDLKSDSTTWTYHHRCFSYCSTQGNRPYMEDRMSFLHDPNSNLSIFGIFDGHGGLYVSDFLECHFASRIRRRLRHSTAWLLGLTGEDDAESVKEAIATEVYSLDDAISQLDPQYTNLTGSTLIAAIVESQRWLTVVNVGDSRAVACDSTGRAIPLSADHKPNDPCEKRRIESLGGFVSNVDCPRVQGILAVSRAFGDTLLKRIGVLSVHPDVVRVDLRERQLRFLLVATDGFWDVVGNDEAVKFSRAYLGSHPRNWHSLSQRLVDLAIERKTQDNVSVLVLRFGVL